MRHFNVGETGQALKRSLDGPGNARCMHGLGSCKLAANESIMVLSTSNFAKKKLSTGNGCFSWPNELNGYFIFRKGVNSLSISIRATSAGSLFK